MYTYLHTYMYIFAGTRCLGAASQAARRQEAGLRAGCGYASGSGTCADAAYPDGHPRAGWL